MWILFLFFFNPSYPFTLKSQVCVLWYFRIYVGSDHCLGSNFGFWYCWAFSEKWIFFGIMMKMRIFCGVITKDKKIFEFQYFWGSSEKWLYFYFGYCDENEDIFGDRHKRWWDDTLDAGSKSSYQEKNRVPPLGLKYLVKIFPRSLVLKLYLKGTAALIISMFYQKELFEPWILIQVSSKSIEKWASYGHLKNSVWPLFWIFN